MKSFLALTACALFAGALAGGCASPDAAEAPPKSVIKKAVDRGSDTDVTSNINQINQALYMIKQDSGPPATLEEAKRAAKLPDQMWFDQVSGKPLVYDPASGTVHREGAAPNSVPAAGSPMMPKGAGVPGGAGF